MLVLSTTPPLLLNKRMGGANFLPFVNACQLAIYFTSW